MKKRIKIDVTLLVFIIIFTLFLYMNQHIYFISRGADDLLDFLGMIIILKGVLLRMSARGHKKAYSGQGGQLVKSGPYALTRNPMYLGSFLIGVGFALIVWPWWILPIFALLFYLRFNRQIVQEEKYLAQLFPKEFADYCQKTPRLLPSIKSVLQTPPKEIFNMNEAWSTKERGGLWAWPLLAIVMEMLQESLIFGSTDPGTVIAIFAGAFVVLIFGLSITYQMK